MVHASITDSFQQQKTAQHVSAYAFIRCVHHKTERGRSEKADGSTYWTPPPLMGRILGLTVSNRTPVIFVYHHLYIMPNYITIITAYYIIAIASLSRLCIIPLFTSIT